MAVLMPAGLGLGLLALALYPGRAANKFGLLTGQIVAVDSPQLIWLVSLSGAVLLTLLLVWRPLTFASLDPEVAAARGVPTRALSIVFMLMLGLSVAVSVQIVGALLVLSLLVTPAAAALRVSSSPLITPLLSVAFAVTEFAGMIMHAAGEIVPHFFRTTGAREFYEGLAQFTLELFIGLGAPRKSGDMRVGGQIAVGLDVVKGWNQLAIGQISRSAEDDDITWSGQGTTGEAFLKRVGGLGWSRVHARWRGGRRL
jgi:hypothetical protein